MNKRIGLFLLTYCIGLSCFAAVPNDDIFDAIRNNNIVEVKNFIKSGTNINVENKFRGTPLHYAIEKENLEIIKLLIANGVDVNVRHIVMAMQYGKSEIVKLLIWETIAKKNNIQLNNELDNNKYTYQGQEVTEESFNKVYEKFKKNLVTVNDEVYDIWIMFEKFINEHTKEEKKDSWLNVKLPENTVNAEFHLNMHVKQIVEILH